LTDLRQHIHYVNEAIADLEYHKTRLERALLRTTLELDSKRKARAEILNEMKRKGDD